MSDWFGRAHLDISQEKNLQRRPILERTSRAGAVVLQQLFNVERVANIV